MDFFKDSRIRVKFNFAEKRFKCILSAIENSVKMIEMIDHDQRELDKSLHGSSICLTILPKDFESICRLGIGRGLRLGLRLENFSKILEGYENVRK